MMTIRRPRLTRMNVSLRVPSRCGSALTEGSEMTVKSGSNPISSSMRLAPSEIFIAWMIGMPPATLPSKLRSRDRSAAARISS